MIKKNYYYGIFSSLNVLISDILEEVAARESIHKIKAWIKMKKV